MGSCIPKVLIPLLGRPLLVRVLQTLREGGIQRIVAVVRPDADDVREALQGQADFAVQQHPGGTGHAVASARDLLQDHSGPVVVACGDSPLFRAQTVQRLLGEHISQRAAVTLAAAHLEDPTGYGRIIRDPSGRVTGIVEERDASPEQQAVTEVNGGLYAFEPAVLWSSLSNQMPDDREFVLTELVGKLVQEGHRVAAVQCDPRELLGVNTPEQLREAEQVLLERGG